MLIWKNKIFFLNIDIEYLYSQNQIPWSFIITLSVISALIVYGIEHFHFRNNFIFAQRNTEMKSTYTSSFHYILLVFLTHSCIIMCFYNLINKKMCISKWNQSKSGKFRHCFKLMFLKLIIKLHWKKCIKYVFVKKYQKKSILPALTVDTLTN